MLTLCLTMRKENSLWEYIPANLTFTNLTLDVLYLIILNIPNLNFISFVNWLIIVLLDGLQTNIIHDYFNKIMVAKIAVK